MNNNKITTVGVIAISVASVAIVDIIATTVYKLVIHEKDDIDDIIMEEI